MELGANLYAFNRAGDTSPPILHADKGSKTQSSYYGSGRQETDSFEGSLTQVICSLPAPTLNLCCQRSQYKFNTNS